MLAVHSDLDVLTVACSLDTRATLADMEREWYHLATTQTAVHTHLSLVHSSFHRFVRNILTRKLASTSAAAAAASERRRSPPSSPIAADGAINSASSPASPVELSSMVSSPGMSRINTSDTTHQSRQRQNHHHQNPGRAPKLTSAVIQRCFDELDLERNGKLPWPRFKAFMSVVCEMRRTPPQFCSRSIPIVCDLPSGISDIEACAILPQWRLLAVSSGKADGRIHLVNGTGEIASTLQNPKQKGLITGVFLVSLPRMVKTVSSIPGMSPQQQQQRRSPKQKEQQAKKLKRRAGGGDGSVSLTSRVNSDETSPTATEGNNDDDGEPPSFGNKNTNNSGDAENDEENEDNNEDDDSDDGEQDENESAGVSIVSAFPQLVTAATDGSIVVWDLRRDGGLDSVKLINLERPVIFLAFDKGTSLFFALLDNGSLVSVEWVPQGKEHVLRIRTARLVMDPIGPHTSHPSCLAVIPALQQVATGGDDAIIGLWKAADLVCICRVVTGSGPKAAIRSLLVLPKLNRIFATHSSRNVTCWDVGSMLLEGKDAIGALRGGHEHNVVGLFGDEIGEFLVSVDSASTICVWHARSLLLLERCEVPLMKWDKRSLAAGTIKCAAYDITTRELTVFANSRMRRFSGMASGQCGARSDQPFEDVCTPALLAKRLLGRSVHLTRLVEVDDASSLLVYVTAWDVAFFSILDGSLVAHLATRDIFGDSIGPEGVCYAFLSHLPPSRRLASDVAASFLSLSDAAGRVVGAVPASVVRATTPNARLECFRRVVLDTAAAVKVKLEPTFPLPGSPSLVIPSLFGVFLFAFRGCMLALSHSCIMTCVMRRRKAVVNQNSSKRKKGGNADDDEDEDDNNNAAGDEEDEANYLILEPVSFQSFQNLAIAPVISRREQHDQQQLSRTASGGGAPGAFALQNQIDISASLVHAKAGLVKSSLNPTSQQQNSKNNNTNNKNADEPTTTTFKLRHLRINCKNRFLSMCHDDVHEVTVFQYNRTSVTPNSTDLVIREARLPSKQHQSHHQQQKGPQPDSSIECDSSGLLFVTYGTERLVAFSLSRTIVPLLQITNLSSGLFHSSRNILGAAQVNKWKMSTMNAGALGKRLILVPQLDDGDASLLESSIRRGRNHNMTQTLSNFSPLGSGGDHDAVGSPLSPSSFSSPPASAGTLRPQKLMTAADNNSNVPASPFLDNSARNDAATDCLILPVSWFVDTFVTAKQAQRHAGETQPDPIVPGTCLVFKPALAEHFTGHSLPENLHHPKRDAVLFPATIGEGGTPVLVKIFPLHHTHAAALHVWRHLSHRAKRCVARVLHFWDTSADAMPRQIPLPEELKPGSAAAAAAALSPSASTAPSPSASAAFGGQSSDAPVQLSAIASSSFNPNSPNFGRRIGVGRRSNANDPPPLRAIVSELGRPRLRDVLHSPVVDRVHTLLSVVECIAELHASGWTCIDVNLNSVVQGSDGRWKLTSLHALRKLPPYGQPEFSASSDSQVMYPWYCDMDFANQWVKRNGQPTNLPSALWATGCLAFELALHSNPFPLETPAHGFFELNDIMEGLSQVIPATVRESIANGRRKAVETLAKKDLGYITIMLDFAAMCLLPSSQAQNSLAYVARQFRLMIEAASAEHHRDEVIRRCDREAGNESDGEESGFHHHRPSASVSDSSSKQTGSTTASGNRLSDAFVATLAGEKLVTFNATDQVPWFSPDLGRFFEQPDRITCIATGANILIAFSLDRMPGVADLFSGTWDPFLINSTNAHRRRSSAVAAALLGGGSDRQRRRSSAAAGGPSMFEVAGAALLAYRRDSSDFIAPPSAQFFMEENERRRNEYCEALQRKLDGAPPDDHSSANFSRHHPASAVAAARAAAGITSSSAAFSSSLEPRGGSMVLLVIDVKDGTSSSGAAGGGVLSAGVGFTVSSGGAASPAAVGVASAGAGVATDKSSRLTREHFICCGVAPAPLFGIYAPGAVKWSVPSRCIGASDRLTIAPPSAAWAAREFGSVANAPTPFADSFAVALLPPDISTLGSSKAPGDECDFSKLTHSCLERAMIGNFESFTTGEVTALFKASGSAPSERARIEAWERQLARRAPFFACAIEAVSQTEGEGRSAVRLGRALEITQKSKRGILDAIQLAHQGDMRRIERSHKKATRQDRGKEDHGSTSTTTTRSATPLGKLKSSSSRPTPKRSSGTFVQTLQGPAPPFSALERYATCANVSQRAPTYPERTTYS